MLSRDHFFNSMFLSFIFLAIFLNPVLSTLPPTFAFEKSCRSIIDKIGCKCIVRIKETRCCCLNHIEDLNESLTVLYLYRPTFEFIDRHYFKNYSKLEEILVDSPMDLLFVDGRAFEYLPNLRKLSITNAPKMKKINGTLVYKNLKLQSLTVSGTGLNSLPQIRMSSSHVLAMDLIDFSFNQILYVGTGQFANFSVKVLRLNGNQISHIGDQAFAKSNFVSLLLNGNREMKSMNPLAFAEIIKLDNLDLSGTQIDELPVIGLKNIEHLNLKNVPNLKKLPPVLAFTHLNKAEFTYPYHCCFFKYANREYERGQVIEYEHHYKEIQDRMCKRETITTRNPTKTTTLKPKQTQNPFYYLFDFFDSHFKLGNSTEDSEEQENLFGEAFSDDEIGDIRIVKDYDATKYENCRKAAVQQFYSNIACSPMPDALNPCEDIVGYPWLRYMIWVIWVMAIIGNILVWIVIITIWQQRSRLHYFFMVNLSIADFLTGIYLGILAIQDARTANEYYNYAVEWQTGWGCSLAGFISVFASELSITSMLMIAFEIYYNARYAFYGKRITSRNAYSLMGIGYLYAIGMAALPLIGVSTYQRTSICLPLSIQSTTDRLYLLFGLSMSLLCFGGMVLNYILINCMIRNPRMPARKQDTQIFRRSLVLISTNMICWVPVLFFGITATLGVPLITLTNAKICLILFYPINSCANPYLYVFLTQMGSEAKKKAVTNLKRHSAEKSFYYLQSPGEHETLRGQDEDHRNASFLQVTMTTSLESTPRGSSASSSTARGSTGSGDRKQSQKSFQEHVLMNAHETPKKPTSIKPRVSAAPEMSVISEHSTNSADDSIKSSKSKKFFLEQIKSALPFSRKRNHDNEIKIPIKTFEEKRQSSSNSLGHDSGIGFSLNSKRFSSSSNTSDEQPRFYVQSSVIQKAHHHKKHPDTPTLVLSKYNSFEIEDGV